MGGGTVCHLLACRDSGIGALPCPVWHRGEGGRRSDLKWCKINAGAQGEERIRFEEKGKPGERQNQHRTNNQQRLGCVLLVQPKWWYSHSWLVACAQGAVFLGTLAARTDNSVQKSKSGKLSQHLLEQQCCQSGQGTLFLAVTCCLSYPPAGGLSSLWCSGWMKMKMCP